MSIEARLAGLEARVAALESKPASGGAPAAARPNVGDALPDSKLDNEWAQKTITKDPPRWKGESMVGRSMADASAEWHDENASFHDWKAQKGREETPVRLKNNGKPWYEADEFTAKLSRAWAKRIRSQRGGRPSASAGDSFADNGGATLGDHDGGDTEIPFIRSADVAARHLRRRARWERW